MLVPAAPALAPELRRSAVNKGVSHMDSSDFLNQIDALLVPSDYRNKLVENVPDGWRFYRKGAYIFAAAPYARVPAGDYGNAYVKFEIRKRMFAFPFFAEKGLFLLYYGPVADWRRHRELHKVDRTALRPIITQSIHYADPETGENYNSRTAWGPVKFGFCGKVIEKIERFCAGIKRQSTNPGKP
jgi:hypothetical protein